MAKKGADFTSGAAVSRTGYGLLKDSTKDYLKKKTEWIKLIL